MFIRTKEDFICEHCGAEVVGNGYTNHCPQCLWSKHVDVDPGDRASACGGLMEPTDVHTKDGEYVLIHTCVRCGHVKPNKVAKGDNFDTVVALCRVKGMTK